MISLTMLHPPGHYNEFGEKRIEGGKNSFHSQFDVVFGGPLTEPGSSILHQWPRLHHLPSL
jgi:hypothetical protein